MTPPASGPRAGGARWRIVLAEDEDAHALLVERALEKSAGAPVEVHRARNGYEVVDLVEETRPHLVLLDLQMPGHTGHEVLETLKGDDELRSIPVAVLTGSERDEDMARSYGLGGNHFIQKSDDPAALERRLRSLLHNLPELSRIRRGSEGLEASAVTAVDPASVAARRTAIWTAVVVVLAGLAAFAYLSGAFS